MQWKWQVQIIWAWKQKTDLGTKNLEPENFTYFQSKLYELLNKKIKPKLNVFKMKIRNLYGIFCSRRKLMEQKSIFILKILLHFMLE